MAKIISASGNEITSTTKPNITEYSSRYGDWVEVLANGGRYENRNILDSDGNIYTRFNNTARDAFGEAMQFPLRGFGKGVGQEVILNEVDMKVIGYISYRGVSNVWAFWGLNGKLIFEIENPEQKDKKGGCYVATCVYGSYDCPEVWTLRRFRDNVLDKSTIGRLFIHTYYAISPGFVKRFGSTKWFNSLLKPVIDKIVIRLQKNSVESDPYSNKFRK